MEADSSGTVIVVLKLSGRKKERKKERKKASFVLWIIT